MREAVSRQLPRRTSRRRGWTFPPPHDKSDRAQRNANHLARGDARSERNGPHRVGAEECVRDALSVVDSAMPMDAPVAFGRSS